jgi:prepilin-type N-terminal cleavage/methylation domain-containing protein
MSRNRRLPKRLRKMIGMTLLEIMIVLAILALVMGLLVGPQVLKMFETSKTDIAKTGARKLATEAYGMWSTRPGNTGKCPTPTQLAEVAGAAKDPWGEEYVVRCDNLPPGAVGIAVFSKGPDKTADNGDDLRSWDE